MSNTKNRLVTKFLGKVPLPAILIVPFVVQIVGVVGLVGYLSLRNGQRAIDDLASQLQNEVSSRIDQHLDTYLETPNQINQINLDATNLGILNLSDFQRVGQYFCKQLQVLNVGYISYGNTQGEFIGVERLNNGNLLINEVSKKTRLGKQYVYETDSQGNRTKLLKIVDYDPRTEAWYADAVKAGKNLWSSIYQWEDKPEVISVSSSYPVYDKNQKIIGVLSIDLILSQIRDFLNRLKIGRSGKAFILERNGLLVANSGQTLPLNVVDGKASRVKAWESSDPTIRLTSQQLVQQVNRLEQINKSQRFVFNINNQPHYVEVVPWQDKLNLDLLIVVVIPQSDFMGQINANTSTTIWLSIAALIVAIIISLLTTHWVTEPIVRLNFAAKDIAKGEWDKTVDIDRSDEVGQLAKSFNHMAAQLKDSFEKLNSVISQAKQVGIKITSSTTQIAEAGKQLEATATENAISTNKVSATAAVIAATSGELVKTMENIAQKSQATALETTNSQANLTQMAEAMRQLAQSTTFISFRLGVMNEKANNINSVVTTITKVADQTNLLSLNATIEAEKAGESGVGFAVVAREIRRLADNTAVATLEIKQMVQEIQSSVSKGVKEMDKFSKEVSNHVEQVGEISGQIAQVIEQVQSLTPHFEEVSHSMERQFEGARQISVAIAQLSEASQQTVASLQETNQVLDQLNDTGQVLQGIISSSVVS